MCCMPSKPQQERGEEFRKAYFGDWSMNKIIEDFNQRLTFGKHRGKTIDEVISVDPSYILWLADETDWEIEEDIIIAAQWAFDDQTFGESPL